jgi:hypothetical protein
MGVRRTFRTDMRRPLLRSSSSGSFSATSARLALTSSASCVKSAALDPVCSAAGCVLERQTLKPVFSLDRSEVMGLKGFMSWVMGQLDSTCSAPPVEIEARISRRRTAVL